MTTDAYRGALAAVDRILNREADADEVLRQTVAALKERVDGFAWVGLYLLEEDRLVLGPASEGAPPDPPVLPLGDGPQVPIVYDGRLVGVLGVEPGPIDAEARAFLERVALLVSAHCLVGWDTGGVAWGDVS
jgi:putative methionine-R-sulfoxide reductase with GAF domain